MKLTYVVIEIRKNVYARNETKVGLTLIRLVGVGDETPPSLVYFAL